MLYSIEPSAVKAICYRAGEVTTIALICGKEIHWDTLAVSDDELYISRETEFECACDKPCPALLVEKGEEP